MLLINAVKEGRTTQVKMFIKVGIDVNEVDENGHTGLIHSCFLQDARVRMKICKALVFAGADINKRDNFGRSLLSWACLKGRVEIVRFLLNDQSCIDLQINVTDKGGNNTLLLSVISGNFPLVKMIVGVLKDSARSSELNKANDAGMRPLIVAFLRGDKLCAQLLVKQAGSSVSSVLKYLKSVQNDPYEFRVSISSLPLFDSSRNEKQTLDSFVQFTQLTEDNIFSFLFAKDEGSLDKQKCKTQEIKDDDKISPQQKILLARRSGLKRRDYTSRERSDTKESSHELGTYSNLFKGSSDYLVMRNELLTHESSAPTRENNKARSSRTSVQKLLILYAEQNSPSFRQGLPVRKYNPAPQPPHINAEGDGELDSRRSSLHPGECDSIAGLSPRLLGESLLDQQTRLKYARNSRAASMQVPRLPSLGRGRVKRTKSSTVMAAVKF